MAFVLDWARGRDHALQEWQSTASTSSNSSRSYSPPPRQPDLSTALDDKQKWERSMARWNTDIGPNNTEYRKALKHYQDALIEKSVDDVLADNFSIHEIRKFESGYVDKKRFEAIHDRQKNDAAAYKDKLAQPPWRDYDADTKASLAFKLTMMHFGLPVEPMRFADSLNLSGSLGNLGLTFASEDDVDEEDDFDDNLTFVPEELRPLRFLNSYDQRGFGKDNSHMNPDKTYELYYGIPMMVPAHQLEQTVSLRGGGDDEADDQPSVMGADEDSMMGDDIVDENTVMSLDPNDNATRLSRLDDPISLRGGFDEAATVHSRSESPINLVESPHDRAQRATSHEIPSAVVPFGAESSLQPRPNIGLSRHGFPMRGERLDDSAKDKIFREWSYSRPLSINMEGQHPTLPINAPPVETILKTPGHNGFPSDAVPVMSTQVMTPTEQKHLEETLFKMRTFALDRAQPCPYQGCRAYFPVDSQGMMAFRQHLKEAHMGTNCPFCPEPLFAHWGLKEIKDHFIVQHMDYFSKKGDLSRDSGIRWPSLKFTHRREEQWNYCARCGRNHTLLINKADRTCHDNQCYPGAEPENVNCRYCLHCGMKHSKDKEDAVGNANTQLVPATDRHVCTLTQEETEVNCFCTQCALPTHAFSRVYAQKHMAHCKGSAEARANWCPWCGLDLKVLPRLQTFQHLGNCGLKPMTGDNPIDTSTGEPMESPQDDPNLLRLKLYFNRNPGQDFFLVPRRCPIERCPEQNLVDLDRQELFDHFHSRHLVETSQMRHCPICDMDFEKRRFTDRSQKVAHLGDHLSQRRLRIVLDNLIAVSSAEWNTPVVLSALEQRSLDEGVPQRRILELEQETAYQEQLIISRDARISQLEAELRQLNDTVPITAGSAQWTSQAPTRTNPTPPKKTITQQQKQQLPSPGHMRTPFMRSHGKRPASARDGENEDDSSHIEIDSDIDHGQPGSSSSAKRPRRGAASPVSEQLSEDDDYETVAVPVNTVGRQEKPVTAPSSSPNVETDGRVSQAAPASSSTPSATQHRWGLWAASGDSTETPPARASRGRKIPSRPRGRSRAQGHAASQPGSSRVTPRARASTTRRGGAAAAATTTRGRAGARASPSTRASARTRDRQATVHSEEDEDA